MIVGGSTSSSQSFQSLNLSQESLWTGPDHMRHTFCIAYCNSLYFFVNVATHNIYYRALETDVWRDILQMKYKYKETDIYYASDCVRLQKLISFWHNSGEGIPVHINNECHATGLLDNTMCAVSYLVLFED